MATISSILEPLAKAILPPSRPPIAEWAEANVRLASGTDVYPTYSLRRSPYAKAVFNWWLDDEIEEIFLLWPTQCGKTVTQCVLTAYSAVHDPGPLIYCMADEVTAKGFVRDRLRKTLENTCPELVPQAQSGDWNDDYGAWIGGLHLLTAWASSEMKVRSWPCRYVIGDETSLWRLPRSLIFERTKKFRLNRKAIWATTPTGPNEQSWIAATEVFQLHRWHVPCPHCGAYQVLEWTRVKFEHCRRDDQSWDLDKVENETYYECEHCQEAITEEDRVAILSQGEARTEYPDRSRRRVSLRCTALDVPDTPMGLTARMFLEAQQNIADMQTWTNAWLVKPWEELSEGLRASKLLAREMDSKFAYCPADTSILLAGVDVQKGKVFAIVRAWKTDGRSQLVYCAEIKDDKGKSTTRALDKLWTEVLDRAWPVEGSNEQLRIAATAIDSGDGNSTERVYQFCYRHKGRVFPCKGQPRSSMPVTYSVVDRYPDGKPMPGTLTLYRVSSGHYRDVIVSAYLAGLSEEGSYGVAKGTPTIYGDQMESWQPTIRKRRDGSTIREFKQLRQNDHFLDGEIYCAALRDVTRGLRFARQGQANKAQPRKQETQQQSSNPDYRPIRRTYG